MPEIYFDPNHFSIKLVATAEQNKLLPDYRQRMMEKMKVLFADRLEEVIKIFEEMMALERNVSHQKTLQKDLAFLRGDQLPASKLEPVGASESSQDIQSVLEKVIYEKALELVEHEGIYWAGKFLEYYHAQKNIERD